MRAREDRRPVSITARMRSEGGWADVAIRNVSAHGMLLLADPPPPAGSYLEIRTADAQYSARTIWADGRRFGVRTRERIDLGRLLGRPARYDAAPAAGAARPSRSRRTDSAARSRMLGRLMQYGFMLAVAVAAAVTLDHLVHEALNNPLQAIQAHLLGGGHMPAARAR